MSATTTAQKYTVGEWITITILAPLISSLIVLIMLPFMLLLAWMRMKIWDWFAVPYLHLPHISVWLMLAIGLFLATFTPSYPSLKKEYYSETPTARAVGSLIVHAISFLLAFVIHLWILPGVPR